MLWGLANTLHDSAIDVLVTTRSLLAETTASSTVLGESSEELWIFTFVEVGSTVD